MRILLLLLTLSSVHASDFANELQQKAVDITKKTKPESLPGYVTSNPSEARLNKVENLEAAGERVMTHNSQAKDFQEMAAQRAYFSIDPEKDPVIKGAQEVAKDPEAFLKSDSYSRRTQSEFVTKTCKESKPATDLVCQSSLLLPTIHIEPAKYSHYWCRSGAHQPDDPSCRAKRYYQTAKKYKDEVITVKKETWTNTCHALEEKTRKGVCRKVRTKCPKGSETKQIKGTFGSTGKMETRSITRPCWRYEHTYKCDYPSVNTCNALRQSSCEQMNSRCIKKIGDECVLWEQTYRCPMEKGEGDLEVSSKPRFDLPEVSAPATYQPNTDMNDAVSKLAIFEQIQHEMRQSPTADTITVFKGEHKTCTVAFAGFKNCCSNGKGWGVSLNVASCSAEEKDLAQKVDKELCLTFGKYCAKRKLGVCLRKKKASCCFPSKLARILHEQGRAQLGIGWGNDKSPDCRGFTPEELSRIDFDKLDLSPVFEEMASRAKAINANIVARNMSNRVKDLTNGSSGSGKGDY